MYNSKKPVYYGCLALFISLMAYAAQQNEITTSTRMGHADLQEQLDVINDPPSILKSSPQEPKQAAQTTQQKPAQTKTDSTIIVSGISKKDLGYHKAFMNHYPDKFALKVNGTQIAEGERITTKDSIITVEYSYEWNPPWGKKIGAKEVTYTIPKNTKEITINFVGWKKEQRISIDGAIRTSDEILIEKQ